MKSPEVVNTDVLTCIFHIFKKHYPKLTIYERINVHLTDLKNDELKLLTSMLMHYTCIYDRQDVLTSPLCHSLKAQTQTSIKFFLEKVQECPSLTNDDLMKIIQQCTEENMEQPNCLNFMANSADASKKSPLYDIFKTPMSKRIKIFEKDKEISHLKATLEVAQEEKDDLEDVLKRHVERNKKLEKQLEQKNAEISRLKSEIVALENRTPPHFRDIDAVETERILKTQIDSLEKIIERCDIENQELQDDRNSEKTRAKMFESQCKTWMEKFLDAEKKLQSLTEHSDEQESKLNSLKKHCEELEALLQEYKPKNSGEESFIEDSFQLAPATKRRSDNYYTSLEDLAHSVVDLQLKEKEKENEEFRSALDDTRRRLEDAMKENANCRNEIETLTNENGDLKDQLQKVVTEYDIMNNKMEEALRENDKFRSEIEILRAENENLKCQKEQLMMKYTELTHQKETIQRKLEEYIQICDEAHKKLEDALIENRLCQSEIETLKVKHENLQDQVEQMRSENTDLNNRYEAMERELEVYVQTCRILENNLENLKIEKEQLSEEKVQILEDLVDSVTKLKLSKVELENVTKEKELVDTDLQEAMSKCNDLEKNLEKLSEHSEAMQKTNNHLQEKIASLESALVQVNQGKDNLESKIEEIESAIVKRDETIEQMKQELNSLEEHNQAIEFENAELKTCKDKVNRTLKSFCGSYRQQLHSLKNEKINLQKNTKSTLENIAYILRTLYKETGELLAEKYECSLKLKEEIEEKTKALSNLEKMKNDNNDVSRQLDESNQANLELKHEIGRLTSKCDALLIELDETRSDMDERILGYEKNVAHLSSQIASLENEKQEAEAERIRLMEELNRAEAELEQFIENCNKLTKENSSLQEGVSSLKLKLDEESSMNNEYVQRVENLTADQATLAEKYQVTIKEKDLLSQMLCEISTEKDVLEGKLRKTTLELQNTISQNMDAISKLEQTLAEQRDKLDSVLNEKLELSSELDALTKEFEETTEKNSELCKSMKNDMNQLRSEKDHMITENENISRALQEQQQSFESLKSRYDESSEKCQQLLAEKELLAHELSEITAVKEGLEIQLKSLEQTIVKFEVKTIELTNSLDIKTDEYHRCADERDELKLEIDKRESDLQHLLSEKEMVKAKLDSQLEECYRKNEELTKQLSEVSTQKDELEVELGDLKQKMHENQEVTKKLDNEITELNQKLDANNKDYQASLNERQHLSNQVSELVSERDSLGVQMAELKLELEKLFSEKQDLQVVLEREIGNLESKLIITETDYQNIKEEKDQLTDQVSVMYSEKTFLESELSTLKVDLQNLLFESKENTNRFEELLKKLKNEMETLNGEKCSLTEELQDQKKAFSSHREKCFAEQQFISNEVVILRDQHSQLSDQVKQFIEETKNVEVVKKLIHDILERYTETCSLVTKLQSENEQLNVENKNISEEFRNAKLHIDVILQKKDGLEKKIEVLQLDSLKLQQRLCDRERELELVTTENEQVRKNHLADSESFNKQTKFYEEEILKTVLENTELKNIKTRFLMNLKITWISVRNINKIFQI
ncbi:unnamed protein product [Acanthoscelides obtectus]|nr:unnamed protein product [Acanthoscelides obtectus]CAK1659796.1 hypothetical protein AOBTE_LOCUS21679 [Acanthoscelides obtectus]